MKINRRKLALILCVGVILLIPQLRSAILPFALALFLAGCLQRPMARLEHCRIPRWLSALAILLMLLTPLVLLLGYGLLSLARSVRDVAQSVIPMLQSQNFLDNWLYRVMTALPPTFQELCLNAFQALSQQKDQLLSLIHISFTLPNANSLLWTILAPLPAKWREPALDRSVT